VSLCDSFPHCRYIVGPSGSGKTSLISVVANLCEKSDVTSGTIKINGDEGNLPKRLVGVVWQDDLLLSNLTVEETIYFSARLKTPCNVSNEKVQSLVEATMEQLGLLHVRHSLIGSSTGGRRGISGGERKRVAVAAELVVRPSLLLLDEPTSGLDATTAWSLISTLQQLAYNGGHAIAVVIHQPRTEIFNMFDHLLLLNHGKMVYNGPPKQARTYLESVPSVTPLPPETGIADWLMKQERWWEHGVATRLTLIVSNDLLRFAARNRGGRLDAAQHRGADLELNRGGPHTVRLSAPCSHRACPHRFRSHL